MSHWEVLGTFKKEKKNKIMMQLSINFTGKNMICHDTRLEDITYTAECLIISSQFDVIINNMHSVNQHLIHNIRSKITEAVYKRCYKNNYLPIVI